MHLADSLSKTNIFTMVFVWIALPEYRKYMGDPIKTRLRKIFISPVESILHAEKRSKS